jgi:demethylmenaquinone methyltransferase/2-methoxy-6-polyprenyl-1,4-benzoquinol methylase
MDEHARSVRRMFASIAPRYDLLNHLLSLNLDRRWRRQAAHAVLDGLTNPRILDLCAGTGDLALAIMRRNAATQLVALDFVHEMLRIGRTKIVRAGESGHITVVCGDALQLPFEAAGFDGLTVAFGVRNLSSVEGGLVEMARVLRAGGRLVILEFMLPRGGLWRRLYAFHFFRVLPQVGRWISGDSSAYNYLPESVAAFAEPEDLSEMIIGAGFEEATWRPLAGGAVALHTARRRS